MLMLPFPFPKASDILLILFLISILFGVTSENLNADERAILLNLKQQLGDPPSLQSWNETSSPCQWPEIECTENSVTNVTLRNKTITQKIPPTVCDLKNLTVLDLAYNDIPGGFPEVLNCTKLEVLDLSQNYFVGPIPTDIDRLSSLQYIDLCCNNFSGDIPPSVGRFSELHTLHLHQNEFNGTFPKEIGELSKLEILSLAYNEKFVPAKIPVEFGKLKNLKSMWMSDANLIGEIPDAITNLTSLQLLDLSTNKLEGTIPSGLFLFKNLTDLYLYRNRLSGEIPNKVEALNLVQLDLSMNNLTGSLPEDLGNLQNLQALNLFTNQLSGVVPSSIGRIPALIDFKVFKNELSGVLPPEIGLYSKLEAFEVSTNLFSGQLPRNLCAKGVLQGVVAFENNLSGEVPESLGNCSTLRTMQLYNNKFSGDIPSGIWTAFNLSSLMLSNNAFSGELPSKLALNLTRLELSDNRFSGQIPVGVASWKKLIVFKASNNLLSGEIPVQLTCLTLLTTLLLDGNRFSSKLPSQIVSWRSLTTLNLSRNELSGEIPAVMGSLPNLHDLDLSGNRFSGEIPDEIGQLKLNKLNFSSNKLSGKVPDEFNNLAYEDSFSNNSHLCANNPVIDLPSCRKIFRNSNNFSSKHLAMILILVFIVLLVSVPLALVAVRDYLRKKRKHDRATWKLTPFHKLHFTESIILSSLTQSNLLGSGGSGQVYRFAINGSDEFVAVKKIWNNRKFDSNLEKQFIAEIEILGKIRHSNIVKLWCCISSEKSMLLVYEYMENQSLDRWLHGRKRRSLSEASSAHHAILDWPTRVQIAIGAAQGLCYMHHGCSHQIIHRDIKSSNILLDSEFNAKIADFGLAKMLAKQGEPQSISTIAGTFGYLAPEYACTQKVNEKIDIYSFGVVLLELVTGKEPIIVDEQSNLAEWSWRRPAEEKAISDAFDQEIMEPVYLEQMTTVFNLGLICTNKSPISRPSMKEVVQILRRCCPTENYGVKKTQRKVDAAPRLGGV